MKSVIPYTRPMGGKRYFSKTDLDSHISKNRFESIKNKL